jgi:large subunit ribosomal protein L3
MSLGILGKKIGMTQVFDESGEAIPVTAVEAGPCPIVQIKTESVDGYTALQLGFGNKREKLLTKPELGHLKKANLEPVRYLKEFRVDDVSDFERGQVLDASIFSPGELVDVSGKSKGRGFTGVVKRWGFKGGRGSHGSEQDLRRPGSIGTSADPSRVRKGVKMAGRTGNERITVQKLEVIKVDTNRNLLALKGSVPGPPNGLLEIKKSAKGK